MTTVCAMLLSICADVDVNWSKAALYFADVMIILFLSVQCSTLHGTVKQNIKSLAGGVCVCAHGFWGSNISIENV